MGCDGGTIPKRHELVKGPKKVEKVDKNAELVAQWNYCTLSQEILRRPIVACELGRLYNKDAIIEFLLDKSSEKALGKAASHIKSIKNVTELRLSDNPAWEGDKGNTKGDKHDDLQRARFICPVVGLEMNGRHRFCFLRCCGCVFSERALKEIKAEVCHTCGAAFQEDDVIVLNGTKEDVETLKRRMEGRRLRSKLGKEQKNPPALRGCSLRSPTKKNQNASPSEDHAFNILTQLEMDLVKFMSKVQNLKAAMATGSNLKLLNSETPAAPHSNITIYEIWGEEDSE
ncbi:replication termination factor 2 isoform X3 [Phocoena sinus]|uniref:Replication termination factor 2 n=1 Tax=Phocoena sinus TaxID=42100 RepID=A0A8C9CUG5_PHOSS|nr:replication termination factor 2 isoform X3 [Phocoena sinus]